MVLHKIYDEVALVRQINAWRLKSETIVFTNGCFDLLHPGHIDYLRKAKSLGSRLVIGLNSDDSVRRQNKDVNRPINNEFFRSTLLESLVFVDAVCIFDQDTPLGLITKFQPDFLVKGADYNPSQKDPSQKDYLVGSAEVLAYGGKVVALELLAGFSTTAIVTKIRA